MVFRWTPRMKTTKLALTKFMNLIDLKPSDMCPHSTGPARCGGCSHWQTPYFEQLEHKKNDLKKKLNTDLAIEVITAGPAFLRTRFDFTISDGKMGLYDQNRSLVDLTTCYQLHPELNQAFQYLRSYKFPIQKGSVRIRLAPAPLADSKRWGLWLDFANIDIKKLLEEKTLLLKLAEKFVIEIGQKKKLLDLSRPNESQLKLKDAEALPWFRSQERTLNCAISSFTQPSWTTADQLSEVIQTWLPSAPTTVIEFGSGIGQFTLPLLSLGHKVDVYESDDFALSCLAQNAQEFATNLMIHSGDFQKTDAELATRFEFALVNPPRSGLQQFALSVTKSNPTKIVYISCFPETLAKDALVFAAAGYEISDVKIVDQFPQTQHYEACVLFQRVDIETT